MLVGTTYIEVIQLLLLAGKAGLQNQNGGLFYKAKCDVLTNKEYVYQKFKSQKVNKKAKNLIAGHHAKARKGRKLTSSDPLTVLTRPLDEYSVNIVQHTDTIIAEDLDYQNLPEQCGVPAGSKCFAPGDFKKYSRNTMHNTNNSRINY